MFQQELFRLLCQKNQRIFPSRSRLPACLSVLLQLLPFPEFIPSALFPSKISLKFSQNGPLFFQVRFEEDSLFLVKSCRNFVKDCFLDAVEESKLPGDSL